MVHWEQSADVTRGYLHAEGALTHFVELHPVDAPDQVDVVFIYGPASRGPYRLTLRQAKQFTARYAAHHYRNIYGQLSAPRPQSAYSLPPSPELNVVQFTVPPRRPRSRRR